MWVQTDICSLYDGANTWLAHTMALPQPISIRNVVEQATRCSSHLHFDCETDSAKHEYSSHCTIGDLWRFFYPLQMCHIDLKRPNCNQFVGRGDPSPKFPRHHIVANAHFSIDKQLHYMAPFSGWYRQRCQWGWWSLPAVICKNCEQMQ
jgi:hypothetical protein